MKLNYKTSCYRCNGFGHNAACCPTNEERCYKCGEIGHVTYQCPDYEENINKLDNNKNK